VRTYPWLSRFFHWVSAAAIAVMLASGFAMTMRGKDLGIWDNLTNGLYSGHKLVGFILLWVVIARLAHRLWRGAPALPSSVPTLQARVARGAHVALYALLLAMPLLGWAMVSTFPALTVFGLFDLPAIASPDRALYTQLANAHAIGALLLTAILAAHIAGALYHGLMLKDGVLRSMWGGQSARTVEGSTGGAQAAPAAGNRGDA